MNISMKQTLLFISYAGFIGVAISSGALNIAWIYIQSDFGLPLSAIGVLLSFGAAMQLLISFNGGRLIQWLGMGKFLLMGCLFELIGMLGYVFTPSWELLLVSSMVMALGMATLINGFNVFIASNYASSRMNWLHASFGLGATIGPTLISVVVLDLESTWRLGYAVMAGLMVCLIMVVLLTIRHWQLPKDPLDQKAKPKTSQSIVRSPIVWFGIGIMFLSAGLETTTGQLSNSLFVNGRGYDPRMVASWISLYWLSYTVGRFVTGMVIDRVNHNQFLRVSMFVTIIGTALIWLNPSPTMNLIGLMIIGFAQAPIAPTLMGDTPRRGGVAQAPYIIGYQNTGAGLGIAFFPSLAGILAEWISLEILGLFLAIIATAMFIVHELLNYQETHHELIESGHD